MSEPSGRVAVVVLGMHRSGTSALTRVLGLLGADLARELAEATEVGGPGGNWEAHSVSAFNKRALAAAGSYWHDPLEIPPDWPRSTDAEALVEAGADLVDDQFGSSQLMVIKDPRICRLVPLWTSILSRRGIEPRFALPIRHPHEVADSLAARNEFAAERSLLVWLRYVLDAERDTRSHRRAFLTYERLLDDWRGVVDALRHALALPLEAPSPDAAAEIDRFLSRDLRHHLREADQGAAESSAERWALGAHRAFVAAADGDNVGLASTLDEIAAELRRFEAGLRTVVAPERQLRVDAERDRNRYRRQYRVARKRAGAARQAARRARRDARAAMRRALAAERSLAGVRGSLSWRLTAPLRRIARRRRSGAR